MVMSWRRCLSPSRRSSSPIGGSGFIILDNKPQEEIEAAAEFLRWMNLPENNAKMCAMSGYLPLTEEAMEQPELQEVYRGRPPC